LAVLGGINWSAAIWDLTNGRQVVLDASDEIHGEREQNAAIGFAGERPIVARVDYFDEPHQQVVIHVKNLQIGRVTRTYTIPDQYATAVAVSPDGHLLAVGLFSGNTLIYESGIDTPDAPLPPAAR
jgi:hypothetical protein